MLEYENDVPQRRHLEIYVEPYLPKPMPCSSATGRRRDARDARPCRGFLVVALAPDALPAASSSSRSRRERQWLWPRTRIPTRTSWIECSGPMRPNVSLVASRRRAGVILERLEHSARATGAAQPAQGAGGARHRRG